MTKLKNFVTCFALAGTVALGSFGKIAFAQRSNGNSRIGLLSQTCLYESAQNYNSEISIDKQVFTTLLLFSGQTGTVTCRLDKRKRLPIETLRLQYGMKDENSNFPSRGVTVFLDGVVADDDEVQAGSMKTKLIDVSRTKSIAIQTVCKNGNGCPWLYFMTAEIIPNTVSEIPATEKINIGRTNSSQNAGVQPLQGSSSALERANQVNKQVDQVKQTMQTIRNIFK